MKIEVFHFLLIALTSLKPSLLAFSGITKRFSIFPKISTTILLRLQVKADVTGKQIYRNQNEGGLEIEMIKKIVKIISIFKLMLKSLAQPQISIFLTEKFTLNDGWEKKN